MLQSHFNSEGLIEAGCDEAGRGCLAGAVFAAAVILPPNYENPLLNDSKQLSAKKREELRTIIERDALAWCVGCLLYTSPSPRDLSTSRMPSSA